MLSEFCRLPYLVVVIPLDQMNLVLAAKAYVLWPVPSRGAQRGGDFRCTQFDFVRYGRALLLLSRLRHHYCVGLAVQTSSVTASADAIVVCAWAPEKGTSAVETIAGK